MTFALAVSIPLAVDFAVLLATGTVGRFLWLLEQAASLLLLTWPITVLALVGMRYGYKLAARARQLSDRQLLWVAPLIVIPITMLVWGAVFAHPRGQGFLAWQLSVLHYSFFTTIAVGVLAVICNPGRRSLVGATALLLVLFSFSCSFTAGSSVTGDWL